MSVYASACSRDQPLSTLLWMGTVRSTMILSIDATPSDSNIDRLYSSPFSLPRSIIASTHSWRHERPTGLAPTPAGRLATRRTVSGTRRGTRMSGDDKRALVGDWGPWS